MRIFRKNSKVVVHEKFVVKHSHNARQLAKKYAAIHDIASASGFIAPSVIGVSEDTLMMSRIVSLVSLADIYTSKNVPLATHVFAKAGHAIGAIHSGLTLSDSCLWAPSAQFVRDSGTELLNQLVTKDWVHLHCDYGFANVFFSVNANKIVVLDPCANNASTRGDFLIGPRYLDLGKFLAGIDGQAGLKGFIRRPPLDLREAYRTSFLRGYQESAAVTVNMNLANAFCRATSLAQFRSRFTFGARLFSYLMFRARERVGAR